MRVVIPLETLASAANRRFLTTTMSAPLESGSSEPARRIENLRAMIAEILTLAAGLRPWVPEFGPDGAENLAMIENSASEVRELLESALSARAPDAAREWPDKDLRHDLRNGMGAVSGFAELIQMETSGSCGALPWVIRLRQCVKTVVELIDS